MIKELFLYCFFSTSLWRQSKTNTSSCHFVQWINCVIALYLLTQLLSTVPAGGNCSQGCTPEPRPSVPARYDLCRKRFQCRSGRVKQYLAQLSKQLHVSIRTVMLYIMIIIATFFENLIVKCWKKCWFLQKVFTWLQFAKAGFCTVINNTFVVIIIDF